MRIEKIERDKRKFLPLLLLADEQESMIDAYLERGDLYALYDSDRDPIGVCVVTREGKDIFEIKNLAVAEHVRQRGYGKMLVQYALGRYKSLGKTMLVGTGETPRILSFYAGCGFVISHRVKNFFEQYDHPMVEDGIRLTDMIYLQKDI